MGPAIAATAPTTSAQALQNENSYAANMKTPDQLLQGEQQNLGTAAAQQQVSGLQQAINNSTNLLNNVAPSVMGRTSNSLETAAQANAEIANEQAPINQSLGQQEQQYNTANTNYQNLEQQAQNLASGQETAQENQLGYLQNVYSALFGQEQQQQQNALAQQQLQAKQSQFAQSQAEQAREANMQYNIGKMQYGAASPTLADTLNGVGSTGQLSGIGYKSGNNGAGGYAFTNSNGGSLSAAGWAQQNGISLSNLLYSMAQSGDKGAQAAYSAIEKNGGKITNQIKSQYSDIFWGT